MNRKRIISVICSVAILTMAVNVFAKDVTIRQGGEGSGYSASFDEAMIDEIVEGLEKRGIEVIKNSEEYQVTDTNVNLSEILPQIFEDAVTKQYEAVTTNDEVQTNDETDNNTVSNDTISNNANANGNKIDYSYTVDSKFSDVKPSDWYFEAVSKCEDLGIIYGYGDGTFGANDPVTLQQVTLMTLRTMAAFVYGTSEVSGLTTPDSKMDQEHITLIRCAEFGFTPGFSTGEPNPRLYYADEMMQPAYREEALSCFYRMFTSNWSEWNFPQRIKEVNDIRGIETVFIENPNIPDYDEIHEYYKKDIYGAYQYGLAHGYDETGAFKPKNEITRAEFCQMMFESGMIETIYLQNKGLV